MKHLAAILFFLSIIFCSTPAKCQDIQWNTQADLSFLNATKEIGIEFKYEIETINGTQTEAEFVAEQKKERNLKNAGIGDKWEKEWKGNRTFLFNPSFVDMFNKRMKGKVQLNDACNGCRYKMVIHVKALRTGKDNKFSTMIGQVPAGGNVLIEIVDDSKNVIGSFEMDNMNVMITPRNDDNFYPWINRAFEKAGKLVSAEILKKM